MRVYIRFVCTGNGFETRKGVERDFNVKNVFVGIRGNILV